MFSMGVNAQVERFVEQIRLMQLLMRNFRPDY